MESKSTKLYLAIDQGGHASRAMLFDEHGNLVCKGEKEIETRCLPGNRVEHDPEELIESVKASISLAVAAIPEDGTSHIESAGLATQRSSIVCWDRQTGAALSPVISWQDRRAAAWMDSHSQYDKQVHETTGLFTTAHYGVSKLKWCLENIPEVRDAQKKGRLAWGPLASYILYHLLDNRPMLIDPANASRTLLWNIDTMQWDSGLMKLFDIPEGSLPECVPTLHDYGYLMAGKNRVPMRIVTGDQSAAMYAYGEPDPGAVYINIGTGAFVQHISRKSLDYAPRLLMSVVSQLDRTTTYVLEGTVNGAGSAFVAVEQEIGMEPRDAQRNLTQWINRDEDVPLFYNGVSGLGSPFWKADFKSAFSRNGEDWEKIVAVAESILFLIRVNLEEMEKICELPPGLVVTGGLSANPALCQRLADLTGKKVTRPGECEATARGTAYLLQEGKSPWSDISGGDEFPPRDNPGFILRYAEWKKVMYSRSGLVIDTDH